MKKQGGFGVLGVIIVIAALMIIGGAGYVIYNRQSSDTKDTSEQTVTTNEAVLSITEWGVGLKNVVADKLEYSYVGKSGKDVFNHDDYESMVVLGYKQGTTQYIGCDPGIDMLRSKIQPKVAGYVKRGDYYYWSYIRSVNCDTGTDVQLAQDFADSYSVSKLELL